MEHLDKSGALWSAISLCPGPAWRSPHAGVVEGEVLRPAPLRHGRGAETGQKLPEADQCAHPDPEASMTCRLYRTNHRDLSHGLFHALHKEIEQGLLQNKILKNQAKESVGGNRRIGSSHQRF